MMMPSPVRLTMRVERDGRVNEVAAERPKARQGAVLVCPGESAISDDVRD